MPVSLAFVYAMTDEVRPLLKASSIQKEFTVIKAGNKIEIRFAAFQGQSVVFCRTGIGMANAHEAAETLLEQAQPQLIVSLGCAGACQPDLRPGDIVLPPEILSETPTDRFGTSGKERNLLEKILNEEKIAYRLGSLMTLWEIAGTPEKEKIGRGGPACVDMETAAVAAIAEKAGIPLIALRVIFDPLGENFPSDEPFDEEHPIAYLLRNPKVILKIPRYARAAALCRKNLFRVVSRFIRDFKNPQTGSRR